MIMTKHQSLRLHGILANVYIDASSRLEFPEEFATQLIDALTESGFRIVPDIQVYPTVALPLPESVGEAGG